MGTISTTERVEVTMSGEPSRMFFLTVSYEQVVHLPMR
jgi:hypothetical protein